MKKTRESSETIEDLLKKQNELVKDQMIVSLGLAGVPQQEIRKIVKVDMTRVTAIVRHFKRGKQNG